MRERQSYFAQRRHIQAQVDAGGLKAVVTEAVPNRLDTNAPFAQPHREGVPETVRRVLPCQPHFPSLLVKHITYGRVIYPSRRISRTQKQLRLRRIRTTMTQVPAQEIESPI